MDLHVSGSHCVALGVCVSCENNAESIVHQCICLYIDGPLVSCIVSCYCVLRIIADGVGVYGLSVAGDVAIYGVSAVLRRCVSCSSDTDV